MSYMQSSNTTHAHRLYVDHGSGPRLVFASRWIDREDCDLFVRNGAKEAWLQDADGVRLYEVMRIAKRDDIYMRRHSNSGGRFQIVSLTD